ncbi:MAG TPA: hypothetical protein VMT16_02805 [Thermoanaerobaculia bacterium]|nr:hypothetical protein [Thermoanaerobaculia bacterium]
MEPTREEGLRQRLRAAGAEELHRLVDEHLGEIDLQAARQALRNPFCDARVILRLLQQRRLVSSYDLRREVAAHPATPLAQAQRLIPGLYWRDLLEIGLDTRLRPTVRRSAELRLIDRLPGLAVGEKRIIARRASAGVVRAVRHDPSPRVIEALLENPRLTEGLLLPTVTAEGAAPAVLALVARSPRWGVRYPLRVALIQNPKTPPATALQLLPMLKKSDLRALLSDLRLPLAVRRRAALLLGQPPA